jgi:CheY-like chemotaxis protein
MNKNGPIVIIEDDEDDRHILGIVLAELGYQNEVSFFEDGPKAIEYLDSDDTSPFLIISDINLPKLNGFEVRDIINKNEKLRSKAIPFIIFTTSSSNYLIKEAYAQSVQGFFVKPDRIETLKESVKAIIEYWRCGCAPAKL